MHLQANSDAIQRDPLGDPECNVCKHSYAHNPAHRFMMGEKAVQRDAENIHK